MINDNCPGPTSIKYTLLLKYCTNNNNYLKSNIHKMFSRLLYNTHIKIQHKINNIAHSNYKQ